jgi:hypothetical protein
VVRANTIGWPASSSPEAHDIDPFGQSFAIVLLGLICGLIFWGQDMRLGVRIRAFDMG